MATAAEKPASEGQVRSCFNVARSLLPTCRLLKLDPSDTLYFPYELGKQVRSAISIKNTSKSSVAFKFQTTAPKSCFMRPPGAILAPGESMITTVFRFIEYPERNEMSVQKKSTVKYRIMSLKVKGITEYVPEMFDEQMEKVVVQRILKVVFLDHERPSSILEKLNRQLAEADAIAALDVTTKKPQMSSGGPNTTTEGLVVDEWKERREILDSTAKQMAGLSLVIPCTYVVQEDNQTRPCA